MTTNNNENVPESKEVLEHILSKVQLSDEDIEIIANHPKVVNGMDRFVSEMLKDDEQDDDENQI